MIQECVITKPFGEMFRAFPLVARESLEDPLLLSMLPTLGTPCGGAEAKFSLPSLADAIGTLCSYVYNISLSVPPIGPSISRVGP